MLLLVDKPWGQEVILFEGENSVVKILKVNPDQNLSLQYHRQKIETMFLTRGTAQVVKLNGMSENRHTLAFNVPLYIKPGDVHSLVAGPDGCEVIEVSSTQLDDVVRLSDAHGRVNLTADEVEDLYKEAATVREEFKLRGPYNSITTRLIF